MFLTSKVLGNFEASLTKTKNNILFKKLIEEVVLFGLILCNLREGGCFEKEFEAKLQKKNEEKEKWVKERNKKERGIVENPSLFMTRNSDLFLLLWETRHTSYKYFSFLPSSSFSAKSLDHGILFALKSSSYFEREHVMKGVIFVSCLKELTDPRLIFDK